MELTLENITHSDLILRAKILIKKAKGVLYKSSIGILKTGLENALNQKDFTDLIEYVPKFEKKYQIKKEELELFIKERQVNHIKTLILFYADYSKEELENLLAKCEKRSKIFEHQWTQERRADEKTMWKANLFNKIEANAKEMNLIKDAIEYFFNNNKN